MPSVDQNITKWNSKFKEFIKEEDYGYRWSKLWGSPLLQWYSTIFPRINEFLPRKHIYEIASGLGRWSEFLEHYCKKLTLSDVSSESIDFLNEKYKYKDNVICFKTDGKTINNSYTIDFLFSFDSLVHCDLDVNEAYIDEFKKKSAKNSICLIHHSNLGAWPEDLKENKHNGWRSKNVSAERINDRIKENNMNLISQELINWGGGHFEYFLDCITILANGENQGKSKFIKNKNFMNAAKRVNSKSKILGRLYNLIFKLRKNSFINFKTEKEFISIINRLYDI
jgi:hypothetical protein